MMAWFAVFSLVWVLSRYFFISRRIATGDYHYHLTPLSCKRTDAVKLVEGLFAGFAPLLERSYPALLKDAVISPGGTTAAGCGALEEHGVRAAMMEAVRKAHELAKSI